jgi:hypothetical protein
VQLGSWDIRCSFLDVVGAFSRNMQELDVAFAEMRSPGGLQNVEPGVYELSKWTLALPTNAL